MDEIGYQFTTALVPSRGGGGGKGDDMLMYDVPHSDTEDLESNGQVPESIFTFREKVRGADAVLIASTENNFGMSAVRIGLEIESKNVLHGAPLHRPDMYNHGTLSFVSSSQAMKNALDWGSRDGNVWDKKPAGVMSAGGGKGGLRSVWSLKQSNGWYLCFVYEGNCVFSLPILVYICIYIYICMYVCVFR
jgi:hypothetical protein